MTIMREKSVRLFNALRRRASRVALSSCAVGDVRKVGSKRFRNGEQTFYNHDEN